MKTNQAEINTGDKKMRLPKQFIALGAIAALMFTMTFGCGEDTPTGSTLQTGNVSDSSFQLVSNQFSPAAADINGLDWIDLLMGELPGFTASSSNGSFRPLLGRGVAQSHSDTVVSITIVVDSASGWITFNATIANFLDTFTVVDSMRFSDIANTPFIPSDSLNTDSIGKLEIRVHGTAVVNDNSEFVGTGVIAASMDIDIIGRDLAGGLDTIRINATETNTLTGVAFDSANGQCDISVSMTSTLTNLVGLIDDTTDACPLSGQAHVTATIDVDCSAGQGTLTFMDTWTVTATFNGGTDATIVFENSTTRWEVTEPCGEGPPPAANSFHRMAGLANASME